MRFAILFILDIPPFVNHSLRRQHTYAFDARTLKNLPIVRRLGKLAAKILVWKVQPLVNAAAPFWEIGDVVDNAIIRNQVDAIRF